MLFVITKNISASLEVEIVDGFDLIDDFKK
jgi:hypothetical protein